MSSRRARTSTLRAPASAVPEDECQLWGCCIATNKPAQIPGSKLWEGDKHASLALLYTSATMSLVGLPKQSRETTKL